MTEYNHRITPFYRHPFCHKRADRRLIRLLRCLFSLMKAHQTRILLTRTEYQKSRCHCSLCCHKYINKLTLAELINSSSISAPPLLLLRIDEVMLLYLVKTRSSLSEMNVFDSDLTYGLVDIVIGNHFKSIASATS